MFTERGGLMLLRLVHLMHLMSMDTNATMLMIGKVWKTLLHRMQISRADGTLQDLAPTLLKLLSQIYNQNSAQRQHNTF